jgi:hypothetical protein
MCLLANASAGLPGLPAGFASNVQTGTPINTLDWKTVGFVTLNDVRVGFPKIAAFELSSTMLPPPTSLAGNDHHCVLALVHHASDQFTATQTVTDLLSLGERKSAHKNLKVVEFTGTLPPSAPIVMAVRIHNPSSRRALLTSLVLGLNGYKGTVRVFLPEIRTSGELRTNLKGARIGQDFDAFTAWSADHIKMIEKNGQSEHPYNRDWSKQRIEDIHKTIAARLMITVTTPKQAQITNIRLAPGERHTLFLLFNRPEDARAGQSFPIDILQLDAALQQIIGGLSARIDVMPAPPRKPPSSPLARPPSGRDRRAAAGRGIAGSARR